MGLSKDPAKAQRQLDGLAAGRMALARKLTDSQGDAKATPRPSPGAAKASPGAPAKPAKAKPRPAKAQADPDQVTYPEERARGDQSTPARGQRRDPEPRRGGGFLDGLRGRV